MKYTLTYKGEVMGEGDYDTIYALVYNILKGKTGGFVRFREAGVLVEVRWGNVLTPMYISCDGKKNDFADRALHG